MGPPELRVSRERFAAALAAAGFDSAGVNAATLSQWYAARITSEGLWRTFARILSDSGHACSATLHAEALAAGVGGSGSGSGTGTTASIYRYFFDFHSVGGLPGATHGSDESWVFDEHEGAPAPQVSLTRDMAAWWASLNADHDPNPRAGSGAPLWRRYVPESAPAVMFMGHGANPKPFMNATADTVRVECEHWKPYLGW